MAPLDSSVLADLRAGQLSTLELWGVGLHASDASHLGAALKSNGTLTVLELGGNKSLGDSGLHAVAPGLREARSLQTLGLDGIGLTDASGKELAAVLMTGLGLGAARPSHRVAEREHQPSALGSRRLQVCEVPKRGDGGRRARYEEGEDGARMARRGGRRRGGCAGSAAFGGGVG